MISARLTKLNPMQSPINPGEKINTRNNAGKYTSNVGHEADSRGLHTSLELCSEGRADEEVQLDEVLLGVVVEVGQELLGGVVLQDPLPVGGHVVITKCRHNVLSLPLQVRLGVIKQTCLQVQTVK